jgi:hypothetical protein
VQAEAFEQQHRTEQGGWWRASQRPTLLRRARACAAVNATPPLMSGSRSMSLGVGVVAVVLSIHQL